MPRLRTMAFLMLLAGLSLGIFTSRALRAIGPGEDPAQPRSGVDPRITVQVDLLQRDRHLNDEQANRVRQALLRYDDQVRARIYQLRQEHAADFRVFSAEAQEAIDAVLAEAAAGR